MIRHNQILAANGIDPSGEPPLQLPPILEFTHVAMKACPWTQRRSLAYDQPGHFLPPSFPTPTTLPLLIYLLSSCVAPGQFTALQLACSSSCFLPTTRCIMQRNAQSLLLLVLYLPPPGCRVVISPESCTTIPHPIHDVTNITPLDVCSWCDSTNYHTLRQVSTPRLWRLRFA